jgi:hypothetical protein
MVFGLITKFMNGFRFTKEQKATLSVAFCSLVLIAISKAKELKALLRNAFNSLALGLSAKR